MTPLRTHLLAPFVLATAAALAFVAEAQAQAKPECAAFVGKWEGAWQQASQGKRWLHVSEVSDQCVAKWAYLEEDREPKGWLTGTIVDGEMAVPSRSMGGTVTYKIKGTEIWANYRSASGNKTNQAVFTRVVPAAN